MEMIEFHVDDHNDLQAYADKKYSEFGGSASVRAPPGMKPIIVFDKMKQFITKTQQTHLTGLGQMVRDHCFQRTMERGS